MQTNFGAVTRFPLGIDFYDMAVAGLITDVLRFGPLGNNPNVTTAAQPEDVWSGAELGVLNGYDHKLIPFMEAATSVEVVSDNVNDTSAGTGMRTIVVQYLDANYDHKTTTITLNGTTAIAFPETVRAINLMVRGAVGTFRSANVGNISIRDTGGLGKTYSYMTAGKGIARSSALTVPLGYTFFEHSVLFSVNRVDTNDRHADFSFASMTSTGAIARALEVAIGSDIPYLHEIPKLPIVAFGEKTTLWCTCEAVSITGTNVTAGFAGIAVKTATLQNPN